MNLNDVVGHPVAVTTLSRAITRQKISHAYLFYGDKGVGKKTTARAFAQQLLCENQTACATCSDCRRFLNGNHANYQEFTGESSIKIQDIRELKSQANYGYEGHRIWLIDKIERMTVQAANSFLKTLEDPSSNNIFILLTAAIDQVLPTVRSRCQLLPFFGLAEEVLIQELHQKIHDSQNQPKRCQSVARLARGSLGRALSLWEGSMLERRQWVLSKLKELPKASIPEVLGYSANWEEDRDGFLMDLELMISWFRDIAAIQVGYDSALYNPDYRNELNALGKLYSKESVHSILEQINEIIPTIKGNARIRFSLNYLLLLMKKGART